MHSWATNCLIGLEPRVQEDGEVGDEAAEINLGPDYGRFKYNSFI